MKSCLMIDGTNLWGDGGPANINVVPVRISHTAERAVVFIVLPAVKRPNKHRARKGRKAGSIERRIGIGITSHKIRSQPTEGLDGDGQRGRP